MKTFETSGLTVELRNVNLRKEQHGDEEQLACDLAVISTGADTSYLIDSLGFEDIAPEVHSALRQWFVLGNVGVIHFGSAFDEHKVTLRNVAMNEPIVVLEGAKLNKFKLVNDPDDESAQAWGFRIQAETNENEVGKLGEQIGHKVMIDIDGPPQQDLPLE